MVEETQEVYVLTPKLIQKLNASKNNRRNNKKLYFKTYSVETLKGVILKAKLLGYTTCEIDKQVFKIEDSNTIQIISNKRFVIDSGDELFRYTSFKSVDLRGVNTSNCKTMKRMFKWATIKEINMSGLDTSNIVNMDEMFAEVEKGIKIVGLEVLNTENLESTRYMFECITLDNLDLSKWNVKKLINIDSMFVCADIKNLKLFSNTKNLESMSETFYNLSTHNLDISKLDTHKVTNMSLLFFKLEVDELNLGRLNVEEIKSANSIFHNIKANKVNIENVNEVIDALNKLSPLDNTLERSIEFLRTNIR